MIFMGLNDLFRKLAVKISIIVGSAWAFILALLIILLWASSGPAFGFSNTWQLFINTFTTIVTLLMVFLIQNTQNRDSKAQHIKLDELLRRMKGKTSDKFVNLEELPDEEIEKMQTQFRKIHERYTEELLKRAKKRNVAKKE